MRLGGRIQAAIEVLQDIEARGRPVSLALKEWGNSHRFAGSGDRNAIGNLAPQPYNDCVARQGGFECIAWHKGYAAPTRPLQVAIATLAEIEAARNQVGFRPNGIAMASGGSLTGSCELRLMLCESRPCRSPSIRASLCKSSAAS